MFRFVSAAARMISSSRLLIANERLEECIDPCDTVINVVSDGDVEQLYPRLEPCIRLLWLQKLLETPTIKDPAKVQAILDQRAVDMCKNINVRLRSVVSNPVFKVFKFQPS